VELINNRVNPVVISPGQTRCSSLWLHMMNDFTLKTSRTKKLSVKLKAQIAQYRKWKMQKNIEIKHDFFFTFEQFDR
jgi:hypothetical protein